MTKKDKKRAFDYGVRRNWTWHDFTRRYRQPSWCQYPDALYGAIGCYSLVGIGGETRELYKRKCSTCSHSKYYDGVSEK